MAYCVEADLQQRYTAGSVTDLADDDTDGAADTDVLDDAIEDASHEVWAAIKDRYSGEDPDGYSAGQVGDVPRLLRSLSSRLALQLLLARRSMQDNDEIARINALLDKLANGERTLDKASASRKPTSTHVGVARVSAPQGTIQHYGDRDPADDDDDTNRPFNTKAPAG